MSTIGVFLIFVISPILNDVVAEAGHSSPSEDLFAYGGRIFFWAWYVIILFTHKWMKNLRILQKFWKKPFLILGGLWSKQRIQDAKRKQLVIKLKLN